jgi:hypothetical protein
MAADDSNSVAGLTQVLVGNFNISDSRRVPLD